MFEVYRTSPVEVSISMTPADALDLMAILRRDAERAWQCAEGETITADAKHMCAEKARQCDAWRAAISRKATR